MQDSVYMNQVLRPLEGPSDWLTALGAFPVNPSSAQVATALAALLTTRGQVIRRGSTGVEAYDAKTANTLLGGDGTDVLSLTAAQVLALLTLDGGSWTPTGTGITNVTSVSPALFRYIPFPTLVLAFGQCSIDPVATGQTTVDLTYPSGLAPATPGFLSTSGVGGHWNQATGYVIGSSSPTRIRFQFVASSASNLTYTLIFGWSLT